MKYTIISIAALAVAAAAQPYHRHHHHHDHLHAAKRQNGVDVVTDVVTTTLAAEVVYVNQSGQPVSTSYVAGPATTTAALSAASIPSSSSSSSTVTFTPPAPETTAASPTSTSVTPPSPETSSADTSASTRSASAAGPSPSDGGSDTSSFGYGLSYSPYNSDGTCKDQDQVTSDFSAFSGYGFIRSYGVDCNQVPLILSAVQSKGMKMFAGIYDIDQVESETQELISAAQNNWDSIYAVTVGNEAVNDGVATVAQVVAAVNQARTMLRAAGYTGPVVTVDTSAQVISNPALCQASDFAAANCHAFFNADLTPDQAGPWVLEQAQRISEACGSKNTMITESGWPNQGESNGMAVPSEANQATAIASLRSSFSNNIVLFSAFNDLWETNTAATFGTNQFWGIYGNAPA